MKIETQVLPKDDIRRGGKVWNRGQVRKDLSRMYSEEEIEDSISLSFSEKDVFNSWNMSGESYKEWLNNKKNPHATIQDVIEKELGRAGFSQEASGDRESPVGRLTAPDGEVRLWVEFIPVE